MKLGYSELVSAVNRIPEAISACTAISTGQQSAIKDLITGFTQSDCFSFEDESQNMVNGLDINEGITKALEAFSEADFSDFGKTIGNIVVAVSDTKRVQGTLDTTVAIEFLQGFANSLDQYTRVEIE